MHTLICVTFSLPSGVRDWLRRLLVALPELVCLPFWLYMLVTLFEKKKKKNINVITMITHVVIQKTVADVSLNKYNHMWTMACTTY